jgi:flagellar P-ring protein precursor FlgI
MQKKEATIKTCDMGLLPWPDCLVKRYLNRLLHVFLFSSLLLLLFPSFAGAIRIKDIASVKGVRENQLTGYGLVVGLKGTGDGSNASFTIQGLANMLENMGIHINRDNLTVKNVAGVVINAKLPPFVKIGQTFDVIVSSAGDASSLQGGTLIAAPLKGLDGKIYAMAQGPLSVGGFESGTPAAGAQKNHLTVARIPSGATVEREVPVSFAGKENITLSLDTPDFTTMSRLVSSIDSLLKGPYSNAKDGATVEITIPEHFKNNEIALLAAVENLEIIPDSPARVILDERTGTVVMGKDVRISRLALSHGNLSLQIGGEAQVLSADQPGRLVPVNDGATLGDVVRALNSIGVSTRDLIAIFQSIKASGALQAELEII